MIRIWRRNWADKRRMGKKTCKSSRKSFLSYNPLIFPHLILAILRLQRFHPMSWGRPEPEQVAGIPEEHRCLHRVSMQGTVSDFWGAHDSAGTVFLKPWELGKWQHLWAAHQKRLWSQTSALGRAEELDGSQMQISTPLWSHLHLYPAERAGLALFRQSPFGDSSPDVFLTLRAAAKQQKTPCLPLGRWWCVAAA